MGLNAMILVFWMLSFKPIFTLLFHFHQEALQVLFILFHTGGVIWISEVIDISLGNFDSSFCSISAGKESGSNAGDLSSILGWENPLEEGKAIHSSILP